MRGTILVDLQATSLTSMKLESSLQDLEVSPKTVVSPLSTPLLCSQCPSGQKTTGKQSEDQKKQSRNDLNRCDGSRSAIHEQQNPRNCSLSSLTDEFLMHLGQKKLRKVPNPFSKNPSPSIPGTLHNTFPKNES